MTAAYDICIIGGGPGGYSAAIRGAQLGGKIALVEKESLGGTCLIHGCIPTKTLYSTSEIIRKISEAGRYGVKTGEASFNFKKIIDRKNEVVEYLKNGIYKLFKEHKIDIFSGAGGIEEIGRVRVNTPKGAEFIGAQNIIVATGSEAEDIAAMRIDGRHVLGNREILNLTKVPGRLVIVGGGAVGCEFANIFERLGAEVTIVEAMDRILPFCEKEISRIITKRFEERGVKVITGQRVVSSRIDGDEVMINLSGNISLTVDKVLMSVGRKLNSFGLGLEEAGIEMEKAAVKVNSGMETTVEGIYAVGDVTGKMALAHVAVQQGKVAAANAMGGNAVMDYSAVPWAIYTFPEVAAVGRGEDELKKGNISYRVGRFPYLANGKAVCMGEEDGFVKVLVSKEDESVLGVHILGAHASDLIGEAALALQKGCKTKDITETIHAHPTLSEALLEAWEDTEGMAVHKAGRRNL